MLGPVQAVTGSRLVEMIESSRVLFIASMFKTSSGPKTSRAWKPSNSKTANLFGDFIFARV